MAKSDTADKPEKYFDDQFDDEEVLYVFKKHPIVMRRGLIYSMLALLLGTLPGYITLEFSYLYGGLVAGFVLSIIVFLPSWINWNFSVFIVTNQRFIQITQKGLFSKSFVDIGLSKIQSTNYEVRGFEQTLLHFGTILIQTYMGDLVIHDIYHPAKTNKKLNEILRTQGVITDDLE